MLLRFVDSIHGPDYVLDLAANDDLKNLVQKLGSILLIVPDITLLNWLIWSCICMSRELHTGISNQRIFSSTANEDHGH